MDRVLEEIIQEAQRAAVKFGPPTSTHEAYGVLAEEMQELLEAIRANSHVDVRREAIQVSAVAMRLADACAELDFAMRSGFKK